MYLNMSKGVWPRTLVTFLLIKGLFSGLHWSWFYWQVICRPVLVTFLLTDHSAAASVICFCWQVACELYAKETDSGKTGQPIHKCVMKNLWIKLLTLTKYERQQTFKSSSLASTDPPNQMLDKPIFCFCFSASFAIGKTCLASPRDAKPLFWTRVRMSSSPWLEYMQMIMAKLEVLCSHVELSLFKM